MMPKFSMNKATKFERSRKRDNLLTLFTRGWITLQKILYISNFLHRIFYSSLVNLLKFYFPDVEDYMEFNLQSESDMIKAWIKDYNIGRRGAMLLNSLIKKNHKLKLIYITNIYHI